LSTPAAIDVENSAHGFDLPSGFITNDEQLKQVADEGIDVLLLDDLLEVDTIPE